MSWFTNLLNATAVNTAVSVLVDYKLSSMNSIGGAAIFQPLQYVGMSPEMSGPTFHAVMVGLTTFFGETIKGTLLKAVPFGARGKAIEDVVLGPFGNAITTGLVYYAGTMPSVTGVLDTTFAGMTPSRAAVQTLGSTLIGSQTTKIVYPWFTGKPAQGI